MNWYGGCARRWNTKSNRRQGKENPFKRAGRGWPRSPCPSLPAASVVNAGAVSWHRASGLTGEGWIASYIAGARGNLNSAKPSACRNPGGIALRRMLHAQTVDVGDREQRGMPMLRSDVSRLVWSGHMQRVSRQGLLRTDHGGRVFPLPSGCTGQGQVKAHAGGRNRLYAVAVSRRVCREMTERKKTQCSLIVMQRRCSR